MSMNIKDKLKYMRMMKEAFDHMIAIEEAKSDGEKEFASAKWREWKKNHPEEIETVKKFMVDEIVRMVRDDYLFGETLLIEVDGIINRKAKKIRLHDEVKE